MVQQHQRAKLSRFHHFWPQPIRRWRIQEIYWFFEHGWTAPPANCPLWTVTVPGGQCLWGAVLCGQSLSQEDSASGTHCPVGTATVPTGQRAPTRFRRTPSPLQDNMKMCQIDVVFCAEPIFGIEKTRGKHPHRESAGCLFGGLDLSASIQVCT